MDLKNKLFTKSAKIVVMGMGYVGLPLAVEFARVGFTVYGYDVDASKIELLSQGKSYISDVSDQDLKNERIRNNLIPTLDPDCIKGADVVIICVPTPLRKTRDPDLTFVISAVQTLVDRVSSDMLIVLESTTYPGTTEEVLAKELRLRGLKVGEDIFVAFSPERVDPGNPEYKTGNIPKVVGGITPSCTEMARELYQHIVPSVYPVSSARTAEMVKLLENTFRSVNIGLINEMAMICHKMGINVWEVIEAAKTKPFGFMAFYPGPGIGGHCIPCDPLYLTWKAKMHGIEPRLVELASEINYRMPYYVVDRLGDILNEHGLAFSRTKILILGVAYKKNVSDTRESPAIEVINLLLEKKAEVSYYDPFVPSIYTVKGKIFSLRSLQEVDGFDCAVVTTDHDGVDYDRVCSSIKIVFDTRGKLRGREGIYCL